MVNEILTFLNVGPGKNFLDLSLGGGGHTEAILTKTSPDGLVIACDRDSSALKRSKVKLSEYNDRIRYVKNNFKDVDRVIHQHKDITLNGAMFDAGLSTDQLNDKQRGFSFLQESQLDMRMDESSGLTAKEVLQQLSEKEIADLIYVYGEERNSRKIARAITDAKRKNELQTTSDFVRIIESASKRTGRLHPATKTFQALRIVVNNELEELRLGLLSLVSLLPAGARIAVITFHSLEDRIVKNEFKNASRLKRVSVLTKKPVTPSRDEIKNNPRSRSAKLRAVEVLEKING